MGVEAPETCWATRKSQVINLWNCCIWLVNLFELYDDARTCQSQKIMEYIGGLLIKSWIVGYIKVASYFDTMIVYIILKKVICSTDLWKYRI